MPVFVTVLASPSIQSVGIPIYRERAYEDRRPAESEVAQVETGQTCDDEDQADQYRQEESVAARDPGSDQRTGQRPRKLRQEERSGLSVIQVQARGQRRQYLSEQDRNNPNDKKSE